MPQYKLIIRGLFLTNETKEMDNVLCVQGDGHGNNRPEGHEAWVQILSLPVTEHLNWTTYFIGLSAPSVKWDISGRLLPVTFLFCEKRYRSHKWQLLDRDPKVIQNTKCFLASPGSFSEQGKNLKMFICTGNHKVCIKILKHHQMEWW